MIELKRKIASDLRAEINAALKQHKSDIDFNKMIYKSSINSAKNNEISQEIFNLCSSLESEFEAVFL